MTTLRLGLLVVTLVLTAMSAGFFYTWSFTVMRGLDAAPGGAAVAAMNAVNAAIRNAWFAPIFFGPLVFGVLAVVAYVPLLPKPVALLVLAAFIAYALGTFAVTLAVHLPMNDALALAARTAEPGTESTLWQAYSARWTAWNHVRTGAAALSFAALLAAWRIA